MQTASPTKKYLLWDASVVIPYYIPTASNLTTGRERAKTILEAARHHRLDTTCLIPNIVIAEVFAAFDRECYSAWDNQITKKYDGKTLDGRRRTSARTRFHRDIHNGALFYQHDLNRYHILALDLISPVDKHMKFYRTENVRSMGASDLLIGAMALHLVKLHGRDNVRLLTADRRMAAIFDSACSNLAAGTARRLGLSDKAPQLGFGPWSGDLYPRVLDLQRCKVGDLRGFFGEWPLKTRKTRHRAAKA